MEFTNLELEEVMSLWQDKSQDPTWIAKDTGYDLERVLDILQYLQDEGQIEGFERPITEKKVLKFRDYLRNQNL